MRILLIPCLLLIAPIAHAQESVYRLAPFTADVTPPIGHACMGGGIKPVEKIGDALSANGFVLIPPHPQPLSPKGRGET